MTCSAHVHQGSWMRPNARPLVHHVHRAGGTLTAPAQLTGCHNKCSCQCQLFGAPCLRQIFCWTVWRSSKAQSQGFPIFWQKVRQTQATSVETHRIGPETPQLSHTKRINTSPLKSEGY